jgi:hypothetical protein
MKAKLSASDKKLSASDKKAGSLLHGHGDGHARLAAISSPMRVYLN